MSKKYYLPRSEAKKLTWLNNFDAKLSLFAAELGVSVAEIEMVHNYTLSFNYSINLLAASKTFTHQCTAFKTMVRGGSVKKKTLDLPVMVMPADMPAVFMSGTFVYISGLVRKLKSNVAYNDTTGKALDIIGVERITNNSDELKPTLSFKVAAGFVQLKYIKRNSDGIVLESKRGNESEFSLLEKITKTTYTDKRINLVQGIPENREYKACYFKNDTLTGLASSVISVLINS